jgi:hypothetical protein
MVPMVDKIKDVPSTIKTVIPEVKFNWDNNNASLVELAHQDKTLLEMHAKFQDQHAHVTNNITNKPTDVTDAQSVNSQETDSDNKTKDAEFSNKPVTKMVKSNLTNNNAMHAKDATMLMKLLLATDVLLESLANASNNTTQPLTPAQTAHKVNLLQVLVLEIILIIQEDAKHSTLVAMLTEEFNCHNNNAINAKHAQLDKSLEEMSVLPQDQLADASKLLIETTVVNHAQLDNWLMQPTQDVLLKPTPVTLETMFWEINSTAMLV